MNRKQIICMWLGITAFVFVSLITKTFYCEKYTIGTLTTWTDYGPLVARWLSVVVVTSGLIYTFKDNKAKKD